MNTQLKLIQTAVRRASTDAERAYWRLRNLDSETIHTLGLTDKLAQGLRELDIADSILTDLDIAVTAALATPDKPRK